MIRDFLIRELNKYNVSDKLADRLLIYGDVPYIKWIVRKFVDPNGGDIYATFDFLADLLDKSRYQIKHAYFQPLTRSLQTIRELPEYEFLISVLCDAYPCRELWDELLPYAFNNVKKLAIELMIADCTENMYVISSKLNVSLSLVYRVRKDYLVRYVQHKGDYPDDTEFDKETVGSF